MRSETMTDLERWLSGDDMRTPREIARDALRRIVRLSALAAVKGEGEDFDDGPPCPICGSKSHGYTGHTPNHD